MLRLCDNFNELPENIRRHFETSIVQTQRISTQVKAECETITSLLNNIKIPSIILKGAAYSNLSNSASLGRSYTDIDILVPKENIDSAAEHLLCYGWTPQILSDYDEKYYREWAHEIPPLYHNKRGTVMDLHHNLIPPISGRAPDIGLFTKNSIEHKTITTLCPSAMVLHSAVHLFTSEEFDKGFRDISDIYLLIEENKSDEFWTQIIELAETTKFTLELFFALRYCEFLFELKVPESIRDDLNAYYKSPLKLKYWDYLFQTVLVPHHHTFNPLGSSLPYRLAFLRGHYIKMPLPTLIKHTAHKIYVSVAETLFGRAIFDKELNEERR
jgi:hypothetical protein